MELNVSGLFRLSHYFLRSEEARVLDNFEPNDKCPICGATELDTLGTSSSHSGADAMSALALMQCTQCGHAFYNKTPTQQALNEFYESSWNVELNANTSSGKVKPNDSPWSAIHHLLALKPAKDARILDFGCGYGDGMATLKHHGFENVFGVEPGQTRYKIASGTFGDRVRCGSLEILDSLTAEHGKFDVIYTNHVAEHLLEPAKIIPKLAEYLAEDGKVVVSVPAPGAESFVHCLLYFPHLHIYSPMSLNRLMQKAGLNGFLWQTDGPQLAVVGTNRTDLSNDFLPMDNSYEASFDTQSLAALNSDAIVQFNKLKDNQTRAVSFQHPWANSETTPSGLKVHGAIGTVSLKLIDVAAKVLLGPFPSSIKIWLLRKSRSVWYRTVTKLTNVTTVEVLFLSKRPNPQESISFVAENKNFLLLDK